MTASTNVSDTVARLAAANSGIGRSARSLPAAVSAWIETCADYYAAAAAYEQLSALSNAELHRRGLSRDTLATAIVRAYDRTTA